MFDLSGIQDRVEELEKKLAEPEVWKDQDLAAKLNKECSHLKNDIERWNKLESGLDDAKVLLELAAEEQDDSVLEEISVSLDEFKLDIDQIKLERTLSGEHDMKDAILSINAGAGGTEAQDWSQMLLRMYLRFFERSGFKAEIIDELPGEEAGIKSVTITVSGDYAFGKLRSEVGVHRLVRISPFDANKRRHTSFAAVFVLPDIEQDIEIDINPDDLKIDRIRAQGPGGQHVNKTSSAVRVTHLPTGFVAMCQNERSQHKNLSMAMKVLKAKLYELEQNKQQEKINKISADKKDIEWGSQIRSYVLQPYQMVKDLRTNHETGNVQSVLDGDIEPFIQAFLLKQSQDAIGSKK